MIISDLNHVEVVTEAAEVKGGGDVLQGTILGQGSNATIGGATRNSFANLALSLPISINIPTGIGIL